MVTGQITASQMDFWLSGEVSVKMSGLRLGDRTAALRQDIEPGSYLRAEWASS